MSWNDASNFAPLRMVRQNLLLQNIISAKIVPRIFEGILFSSNIDVFPHNSAHKNITPIMEKLQKLEGVFRRYPPPPPSDTILMGSSRKLMLLKLHGMLMSLGRIENIHFTAMCLKANSTE